MVCRFVRSPTTSEFADKTGLEEYRSLSTDIGKTLFEGAETGAKAVSFLEGGLDIISFGGYSLITGVVGEDISQKSLSRFDRTLRIIAGASSFLGPMSSAGKSTLFIDPKEVRYTQSSIKATFKDGRSVLELAEGLKSGSISPESVPPIRIFEEGGKLWTLDNRRLAAFELAQIDVPYVWATTQEVIKESWKRTTQNDGVSILIRKLNIIVGGPY